MVRESGLRRGWTTGACATAAAKSAYGALLTGTFEDPVTIALPRGQRAAFALAGHRLADGAATASVVKDAGDDPDVTHGALIEATVRASPGGLRFRAGPGVGVGDQAGTAGGARRARDQPGAAPDDRRRHRRNRGGATESQAMSRSRSRFPAARSSRGRR